MIQTELPPDTGLIDDNGLVGGRRPNNFRWFWTQTGLDCYEIQADCDNCVVFKTTGMHKDSLNKPCAQSRFNQFLISKGIARPLTLKTEYKAPKRWVKLSSQDCYILSLELFRLVSELEQPTNRSLLTALTKSQFLGRVDWTSDIINGHMERLKKAGVLRHQAGSKLAHGALVWEPVDVSKIIDPKDKVHKPAKPMPQMIINERSAMKSVGLS